VPPELAILIGIPACGKSTFYRERLAATHALVSKDAFPNNRNRDRRQRQLVEEALDAGRSAAVDNNNPTRAERAALIAMARERGLRTVGYYFESRVSDALARNERREGRARVPDVAIYSMAKALERPALDEGFAALFHVRLDPAGGFVVSGWQPDAKGEPAR
jgi:predicted kinase